jgi:hypothetical protein
MDIPRSEAGPRSGALASLQSTKHRVTPVISVEMCWDSDLVAIYCGAFALMFTAGHSRLLIERRDTARHFVTHGFP